MNTDKELPKVICSAIASVVQSKTVPLHEPSFQGQEWAYLKDCLNSTFVSSVGAYVDRFERAIAKFTGADFAIAVSSGTSGLHIALKLVGVKPQDEVLVPSLSFVATANAVAYCFAQPHFIDCYIDHPAVDPEKLDQYLHVETEQRDGQCVNKKTQNIIRAIVPMHVFGHPVDMNALNIVAYEHNIKVVEDAAESLGSFYKTKHTGTLSELGVLSFNGNKIITTGGGGAILTNNETFAKRAKHLTTTAKIPHKWDFNHDEIGYNYRMPNLNAALGCAQLEQIESFIKSKRELYRLYKLKLEHISEIKLMAETIGNQSNYWLQAIVLSEKVKDQFDKILKVTNNFGISTRPIWKPLDELTPYVNCPRMDLSRAKSLSKRIINLPSSSNLIVD
jgi:perosamine synthetase